LIRKNEFCLWEDLFNWVVAAQTAIDKWISMLLKKFGAAMVAREASHILQLEDWNLEAL